MLRVLPVGVIRIKGEADPFGMNWVRASCIYAETPQSLEPLLRGFSLLERPPFAQILCARARTGREGEPRRSP